MKNSSWSWEIWKIKCQLVYLYSTMSKVLQKNKIQYKRDFNDIESKIIHKIIFFYMFHCWLTYLIDSIHCLVYFDSFIIKLLYDCFMWQYGIYVKRYVASTYPPSNTFNILSWTNKYTNYKKWIHRQSGKIVTCHTVRYTKQ